MKRNRRLSRSISDAGWTQFRNWVEYFGKIFGKVTVAVNPAYKSQICSGCGQIVRKDLKVRQHVCGCGINMDRDHNAAVNILKLGLRMAGHARTGEETPETLVEMNVNPAPAGRSSLKQESYGLSP